MMKKIFFALCTFSVWGISDIKGQVTFAKDISPIIYNHCSVCHRPGEIAPFSLTNYEEVKNWASTIKYTTAIKFMPPWKADPEYSNLLGANYLTDHQIDLIAQWVDNGAEYGNASDEAAYPEFPSGSVLGQPDLVLEMEESHLHKGNNDDEYRYFVLPTGLTEDKILKALEMRPGNRQIVHHALFFEDTEGEARARDAQTPEYGFEGFGGFSTGTESEILTSKQFPGYVPGQKPLFYPDGLGQTLTAGSDLVVQVHYAPWSQDEIDRSTFNLFFAKEDEVIDRIVDTHIMVPLPGVLVNDIFIIPANQVKTFHGVWTVPEDLSFIGITPHMHLLGQDWTVYIEKPDGTITHMISVPDWDFNWQGNYYFDRYLVAPQGSKIHAYATYDNTAENPNNPSSPPRFVTWGEKTTDEMFYLPLSFVPYKQGDENVIFSENSTAIDEVDVSLPENKIYPIFPNPVDGLVNAGFSISQGKALDIQLLDLNGQVVRQLRQNQFYGTGKHIINIQTAYLPDGIYILNIQGKNVNLTEKLVKQK